MSCGTISLVLTVLGTSMGISSFMRLSTTREYESNEVFFDGHCNLCNGFVHFVADRDPHGRVRFGAIQRHGDYLRELGAPTDLSTVVLVQNGQVYTHSDAALRTMALLTFPWNALSALHALPRPARDLGYRVVARYRYAVFGSTQTCRSPRPGDEGRFIQSTPIKSGSLGGFKHSGGV